MSGEAKRILVVEDNQAMAGVIRFNLERAGFSVSTAFNGCEALELVEEEDCFDYIITDHQMPKMSGEEFCRKLRQDEDYHETPILMCSAKGLELDREQLREQLGIERVLFKPFSPREIVEIVLESLEQTTTAI